MWVSAGFYVVNACVRVCACVCVRDRLPLTYVPSFVSEDYSFPFEVRQLARRGRSERRPRAGFHTSPAAACRLGGKYVCRPQRRREEREKARRSEKGAEKRGRKCKREEGHQRREKRDERRKGTNDEMGKKEKEENSHGSQRSEWECLGGERERRGRLGFGNRGI